jgi:chromosome partitioning protein
VRTVAIMNQKGGCGKTTTAINLAGALAKRGRPTLLVDLDPQSHCAAGLAVPESKIDLSSAELLLTGGDRAIDETRLLWTAARHLELAPSTVKLAGLEASRGGIAEKADRDARLAGALGRLADRFEFCVIDCPPSIGLLTFNALRAADELIIPVETAFLSLHGAQRQVQTVRSIGRRLGTAPPYSILATMHNAESSMARSVLAELRRAFEDRMIPTPIRLDAKLREAVSFGQPAVEYAPESWGAEDYRAIAEWLEFRTHAGPPTFQDDEHDIVVRVTGPRAPEADPVSSEAADRVRHARRAAVERDRAEGVATAASPPASDRARDLADRARRLLSRSAEIQERISRARGVHLAPEPEPPANGDGARRKPARRPTELYGVRETAKGALFVHPADREASVAIAADFNGWSAAAHPMRYNEALGVHEASVPLPPGTYEYRLVVDGAWIADPFNPDTRSNPYGGTNSRFVIRGAAAAASSAEGSD